MEWKEKKKELEESPKGVIREAAAIRHCSEQAENVVRLISFEVTTNGSCYVQPGQCRETKVMKAGGGCKFLEEGSKGSSRCHIRRKRKKERKKNTFKMVYSGIKRFFS